MNFKKAISLLTLMATTSLLYGCNGQEKVEYKVSQEQPEADIIQVYTVQVESIEGNTVHAIIGQLNEQDGPPALPEGEKPNGQMPPDLPEGEMLEGEAPALPEGMQQGEMPPAKPEGGMKTFEQSDKKITFSIKADAEITVEMLQGNQVGSLESIGINNVLQITLDANHEAQSIVVKNLQVGGGFGGSHTVTQGTSKQTIDTDSSQKGENYTSTGDDENALRIDGAQVTLDSITVEKLQGESSNTENGDFYGQNAALLATNGADVTIKGSTVTTSTVNGNGIFSYGENTTVTVEDTTIKTSGRNSGGIQTTGGGTTYAHNLQVETQGDSSAAIRSDRGGGIVQVTGGQYTTNGIGSPAIYSTADITVEDASLTANHSEAIVIEGKNSVHVKNCNIVGSMDGSHLNTQSDNIQNIMIYQSMSGDAEIGHSTFTAEDGQITAQQGDLFYVTNTTCTIDLARVKLELANDILLKVAGNESTRGWGTPGSNGGKCTLKASQQVLEGKVIVDDISTLDINLENESLFTGSINEERSEGNIKVVLDDTSQWVLTADTYITELEGSLDQVHTNGYHLYVDGQLVK